MQNTTGQPDSLKRPNNCCGTQKTRNCSGDIISGDIHPELSVTNEVPCAVQTAEVAHIIAEFLRQLGAHFKKVRCEFITADNHARLTKKPQYKEAGYNTYNYLAGELIKTKLSQVRNIEFNSVRNILTILFLTKTRRENENLLTA